MTKQKKRQGTPLTLAKIRRTLDFMAVEPEKYEILTIERGECYRIRFSKRITKAYAHLVALKLGMTYHTRVRNPNYYNFELTVRRSEENALFHKDLHRTAKVTDNFSDRPDASLRTSLWEYGVARNPKTGKTLLYNGDYPSTPRPRVHVMTITKRNVRDLLREKSEGFWEFIGEDRNEAMKKLDNQYLSHYIMSIRSWSGEFD